MGCPRSSIAVAVSVTALVKPVVVIDVIVSHCLLKFLAVAIVKAIVSVTEMPARVPRIVTEPTQGVPTRVILTLQMVDGWTIGVIVADAVPVTMDDVYVRKESVCV